MFHIQKPSQTVGIWKLGTNLQKVGTWPWEGWVTVRLHRKRHCSGWLVRTAREGVNSQSEEILNTRFSLCFPLSRFWTLCCVHHHMWHLDLYWCSFFPERRDNNMIVERFPILDTFGSPKILVPKWVLFVVTQGRTTQQQYSPVDSHR